MIRRLFVVVAAALFLSLPALAQEKTPNAAAHGSEKVAHEVAHPQEAHGEGHAAPKTYFGIPGWILKLVNMIVFIGVLGYLIGGPIRNSFAARRREIQTQLAEAAARREKADTLAREIEERLAKLEHDVGAILERASEEGERQKQELIAAGEADAQKVLASARAEVDARVKMARQELTDLAANVATERATALLAQTIEESDRKRLFSESLGALGEVKR